MNASLASLISVLLAFTASSTEAEQYRNEYQVKANYLYQMAKFIDWPELNNNSNSSNSNSSNKPPLNFCVFGKDPFRGALEKVHLQKVKNRVMHISYINQEFEISRCNILFVQKNAPSDFIKKRYPLIIKNNILTIGEDKEFSKNGGIISLSFNNQKLSIEINLQAAKDANIKVNSNLIEIASHIYQDESN